MPTTHIVSPMKGMITNIQPIALPPDASPFINGCYLNNGQIISDYGYISYPIPSITQSNQLLGSVMTIENFTLSSGVEYLLCLTTLFVYNWNTQSMTWNNITLGVYIDTGGDSWTASANVTSTNDATIFIYGTSSTKLAIAAGFSTGVIAYKNFSAIDASASTLTNIAFWIYSNVSLAANVLGVRLSAQNNGGTGAVYATYAVPALTAGVWQHCTVLLSQPIAKSSGFVPSNLSSILSSSLIAISNPGVCNVYINDIQTNQCFSGTLDDRFSVDIIYDTLIITNGVDVPSKIDSSLVHTTMTLTLPNGGAITSSKVVRAFLDHVLFFNNTENGSTVPRRCSWTNIGSITDLSLGTSGFQDLTDSDDSIVAVEVLSEILMIIYRDNSIFLCTWVGGHTPFRFDPLIKGYGALSKDSVTFVEGYHVVIDNADIYVCNGTSEVQVIDAAIQQYLFNNLNGLYTARTFTRFSKIDNEIEFWICSQNTTPDQGFVFNQVNANWYIRSRNISGWGTYQTQSLLTISELVGTIADQNFTFGSQILKSFFPITLLGNISGQVFQLNKTSVNNNGTAIPSEYNTPDYVQPGDPNNFENKFMRVGKFIIEATGTTVTVQYSIDGGMNWNPTQSNGTNIIALSNIPTIYEQYFEVNCNRIRFKFTGGPFAIRYFAFSWMLRSERR